MKNDGIDDKLLTIPETALKLRVSERTVARLIADGQLHAPKIRRRRFISTASLHQLLMQETACFS